MKTKDQKHYSELLSIIDNTNNYELVKSLFERKFNFTVYERWNKIYEVLCQAIDKGHTNIIQTFLSKGIPMYVDHWLMATSSPIYVAIRLDDVKMLNDFVNEGANLDNFTFCGITPLSIAVVSKSRASVEFLLKNGADVNKSNAPDYDLESMVHENLLRLPDEADKLAFYTDSNLHYAVVFKDEIIIEMLLRYGADVNAKGSEEYTPIRQAFVSRIPRALRGTGNIDLTKRSWNFKDMYESTKLDYKNIQLLLEYGADANDKSMDDELLLFSAISRRDVKLVELLLKHGADINARLNDGGDKALHVACRLHNPEIVELLLKHGDVNVENNDGQTPLFYSVSEVDIELAKLLLENGADVNKRDNDGVSPLHVACYICDYKMIKLLLKSGADVNAKNNMGETPIFYAISEQDEAKRTRLNLPYCANEVSQHYIDRDVMLRIKSMKRLLKYGANVNITKVSGETPLLVAAACDDWETICLLLESGADINARNAKHATALHMAPSDHYSVVHYSFEILLEMGADVNAADHAGTTPLLLTCKSNNASEIKLCVKYGAEINTMDRDGNTPFLFAVRFCNDEIIKYFLKLGGNINVKDQNGRTLLYNDYYKDMIECALKNGADPNVADNNLDSPLDFALSRSNFADSVDALLEYGADVDTCKKIPPNAPVSDLNSVYCILRLVHLRVLSSELNQVNSYRHWDDRQLKIFLKYPENEFKELKGNKFCSENVYPLHYYLTNDMRELVYYVRRGNLYNFFYSEDEGENELNSKKLYVKYPMYSVLVKRGLRMGKQRIELLRQTELVYSLFNSLLPNLCVDIIIDNLSNYDLKNLIDDLTNDLRDL